MKKRVVKYCVISVSLLLGLAQTVYAIDDNALRNHVSLKNGGKLALGEVDVPVPPNLDAFIVNKNAALVLGKAFFWDMQTGGDGVQACASCHFHSGADSRTKNQINPGTLDTVDTSLTFGASGFSDVTGPNYTLMPDDFPFPKELNDVVSSQGVFLRLFSPSVFDPADACVTDSDETFNVVNTNVRLVEPRNTPTTINAVFNHRNFWDGRANDTFNGVNPAGIRDMDAKVAVVQGSAVVLKRLVDENQLNVFGVPKPLLLNSSLASQAVGPPLSEFEMSCGTARSFPDLGRKLLRLRPLAGQKVAADDSVLGPYQYVTGKGLKTTYARLISQAFDRKYWNSRTRIDGFSQMEYNFSLFWGLAIQMYEATLVADKTPYDTWASATGFSDALTEEEKLGLAVFSGFSPVGMNVTDGKCINCHVGPEFTGASVRLRACEEAGGNEESIERMIMGNNLPALYDGGFYNIAVRQTLEDLGVGEDNLAFSRQVAENNVVDFFCINEGAFEVPGAIVLAPPERIAVLGAHKVPTIRNVELTAPYFHSGGHSTLAQVVEFYDSGAGDNNCSETLGELGFKEENINNLDPHIQCLNFNPAEEAALVAFMKALTDENVRNERAPFDHPQLFVVNGHPVNENLVDQNNPDRPFEAQDTIVEIPAVGAAGRTPPSDFLVLPQQF